MTKEQLEKANKLSKEIERIGSLVSTLGATVEAHKEKCNSGKTTRVITSLLRFMNRRKRIDEPEEANIVLFRDKDGDSFHHAIDIPVDVEVVEVLRDYFNDRLKKMEDEFARIGKSED